MYATVRAFNKFLPLLGQVMILVIVRINRDVCRSRGSLMISCRSQGRVEIIVIIEKFDDFLPLPEHV